MDYTHSVGMQNTLDALVFRVCKNLKISHMTFNCLTLSSGGRCNKADTSNRRVLDFALPFRGIQRSAIVITYSDFWISRAIEHNFRIVLEILPLKFKHNASGKCKSGIITSLYTRDLNGVNFTDLRLQLPRSASERAALASSHYHLHFSSIRPTSPSVNSFKPFPTTNHSQTFFVLILRPQFPPRLIQTMLIMFHGLPQVIQDTFQCICFKRAFEFVQKFMADLQI